MSEIYPLGEYKDKYIELLDDYEFDPGDVVAMGNLIGFLSNYLYSPVAVSYTHLTLPTTERV